MSDRLAKLIDHLHSLGILPGDRIAAFLPNGPLLIDLLFASWHLGANLCPLNTRLPKVKVQEYLERLQPKLYVDSQNFFPQKSAPCSVFSSLFLFTSGSTIEPKIAVLSKENLLANARQSVKILDLQPTDTWALSLPLFHVGGIGIVLRTFLAKARLALSWKDPSITHISQVPTQLYRASPVYKNLRCILLGGAPVQNLNPFLPIFVTYGMTEMGSIITVRSRPPCMQGPVYLGHPLPGQEVRISPEGEVLVRGPTLFQGYWEKGELFLPKQDGWFATGDLGHYCEKEGLAILGRKDWQFISGGENIQPEEIEKYLLQFPGIEDAVVIPKADPEFGKRPVAILQGVEGSFKTDTIQTYLLKLLPKYKIPQEFYIHQGEFPRKGMKVDRKALVEQYFSRYQRADCTKTRH